MEEVLGDQAMGEHVPGEQVLVQEQGHLHLN